MKRNNDNGWDLSAFDCKIVCSAAWAHQGTVTDLNPIKFKDFHPRKGSSVTSDDLHRYKDHFTNYGLSYHSWVDFRGTVGVELRTLEAIKLRSTPTNMPTIEDLFEED